MCAFVSCSLDTTTCVKAESLTSIYCYVGAGVGGRRVEGMGGGGGGGGETDRLEHAVEFQVIYNLALQRR